MKGKKYLTVGTNNMLTEELDKYIEINTWPVPYQTGYHPETQSRAYKGGGMLWKMSCINLFIIYMYFRQMFLWGK